MIQTLFEKGCAVEIPTSERYGEQNRFGNGEVLFVFASSSGLPFYKETVDKGGKFKWDIAMLPNTRQAGGQPVRRQRQRLQDHPGEGTGGLAGDQVPGR